jgi:hypothetical protein
MNAEQGDETRRPDRRAERPVAEVLPIAWPVLVAFVVIIAGFLILPDSLRAGPGVFAPVLMAACTVTLAGLIWLDHYRWPGHPALRLWTRRISLGVIAGMTVAVGASAFYLVQGLPKKEVQPLDLLLDGALIWVINALVFTVWYWEIDAGGPHARKERGYRTEDFVFPQFSADDPKLGDDWMPNFIHYLFLAFNTSTAFSPTDTMVLSRPAKTLMMCQSALSLVVFGVLLARAIGTI